jgi:hypothetical protein
MVLIGSYGTLCLIFSPPLPLIELSFEVSSQTKLGDNVRVRRAQIFQPTATQRLPNPTKLTFDERREPANYGLIPNHDANVTFGFANVDT